MGFNYTIAQESGVAELYIDRGNSVENKAIFDQLYARRSEIELAFGGALTWERLDTKRLSLIKHTIDRGGYRSSEAEWPEIQAEMVEAMTRLDAALTPALSSITLPR